MKASSKTKQALIKELEYLRQRVADRERPESERKQANEILQILTELVNIALASITVHDFDGRFLYANQKTFDLHGYSREDFFAATLHDIDVSKSDGLIAYRMEQLIKTGEVSFEVSHFRKDGSTLPLSVQARIGNWGGTNVVLSIASDITESKETKNVEEKNRNKIPGIL